MTENEAIKTFEEPTKHIKKILLDGEETICYSTDMVKAFEMAIQALEEIQQYRVIGTIEEFKALKEKDEPKKPIKHDSYYVCPCCGNTEIEYCNEVDCRTIRLKRCTLCEQKLDWSE